MDSIKVVVKRVGEDPVITEIENNYLGMQEAVGGYAEQVYSLDGVSFLACEDGNRLNMPFNVRLGSNAVRGTVLAMVAEGSEFVSMDDSVAWKVVDLLSVNKITASTGRGSLPEDKQQAIREALRNTKTGSTETMNMFGNLEVVEGEDGQTFTVPRSKLLGFITKDSDGKEEVISLGESIGHEKIEESDLNITGYIGTTGERKKPNGPTSLTRTDFDRMSADSVEDNEAYNAYVKGDNSLQEKFNKHIFLMKVGDVQKKLPPFETVDSGTVVKDEDRYKGRPVTGLSILLNANALLLKRLGRDVYNMGNCSFCEEELKFDNVALDENNIFYVHQGTGLVCGDCKDKVKLSGDNIDTVMNRLEYTLNYWEEKYKDNLDNRVLALTVYDTIKIMDAQDYKKFIDNWNEAVLDYDYPDKEKKLLPEALTDKVLKFSNNKHIFRFIPFGREDLVEEFLRSIPLERVQYEGEWYEHNNKYYIKDDPSIIRGSLSPLPEKNLEWLVRKLINS